jgi:hypothetical protein
MIYDLVCVVLAVILIHYEWQLIDIHAHAAIIDSLPNAIMEGMSLAKPAVVTGVGGISTMVLDGKTGFVVPPHDPQDSGKRRYMEHVGVSQRLPSRAVPDNARAQKSDKTALGERSDRFCTSKCRE